jgi:hypothetical protein
VTSASGPPAAGSRREDDDDDSGNRGKGGFTNEAAARLQATAKLGASIEDSDAAQAAAGPTQALRKGASAAPTRSGTPPPYALWQKACQLASTIEDAAAECGNFA